MSDDQDDTETSTPSPNTTDASMTTTQPLAFLLDGWEAHQAHLIAALAPLTPEQLAVRPAPDLRNVEELARHILGARVGWFTQALREGDEAFAAYGTWDRPDAPTRAASELVAGLEATWRVMRAALERYSLADLAETLSGVRHGQPWSFARGWIVWHVLEHDLHHGGEIGYSLGMHGIQAPDI